MTMKTRSFFKSRGWAVLFVLLAVIPCWAADDAVTVFDRWYVLEMSGERAGYVHVTERHKDGQIITQSDTMISIRRGDQAITMKHDMWFIETHDGKPVEASSSLSPGAIAIVHRLVFGDDGVEQTTGQGDAARTTTLPPVNPAYLPPAAAQRLIEQKIAQGETHITGKMIDTSMGVTLLDMSMTRGAEENVEVLGKVVPAVVWDSTVSSMPGIKVRGYFDQQGRPLKTTVQLMPGMDLVMIEADEQLAKAKVDPPEMMARSLIRPDKPIEHPRDLRHAIYRISIQGRGGAGLHLPRAGYQRVVYDNQTTAAVILDLDSPVNVIDDLPGKAHTEPSNMIDHDHARVRELLAQALPGDTSGLSASARASRLRAFVYDYIDEKDLSVGLASAGEVAQTAQGDCTEHAVLLAALLRAEGIPSRTVSGLIYVDRFLGEQGVFGYHMWTQAWLPGVSDADHAESDAQGKVSGGKSGGGGRWVDLDAVLDGQDFDASHILLNVSAMQDGQMVNDMIDMLPMLGGLEVQVIEAE